ncbi:MAG TPA: ABC transporter substrate-binding protein [Candidatus Binatia bacterium]|nr:ABC transporter substrate-binding protein [Candidatus Binatia bacterium]
MRTRPLVPLLLAILVLVPLAAAAAPPADTLVIGLHVTLATRWLDPGQTEALITPFMMLYAIHDALTKPMPGKLITPSLAESWTASKDGLSYDFMIRKGVKFHNGDPVTAEDVKFTFERYKGASAALLKSKVKEVQVLAPNHVRFILKEPWPDFMAFYGTSATGAAWIVPKKYIEKVGEDAFQKAPVGAGPYKVVSVSPGNELRLEAFADYWRKKPAVKNLIMRSIPDESTRAVAVKTGEVDLAYLFGGAVAQDLKRSPGITMKAPLLYGMYWLDFLDQWDPKSPWHDKRVRLAASLAIDREAINQAEMLGLGKATGAFVPPEFDFALKVDPPKRDVARAKQLLAEAGYPSGFDAGDLTPLPPYSSLAEEVGNFLGEVGIRASVRNMERATFMSSWHDKKLKGLLIGATGAAGNAASRLEPFMTKGGLYAYGSRPDVDDLFQQQAKELDRGKREAILHTIQKIVTDEVLAAPIFQQGFVCAVGPRVAESTLGMIQGFPYVGPAEDAKLK